MLVLKRKILKYLAANDNSQYHDVSHIMKASSLKNDPLQLKRFIDQLCDGKVIYLQNSTDNSDKNVYENPTYTLYCRIGDVQAELTKEEFFEIFNERKHRKSQSILAIIALSVTVILGAIGILNRDKFLDSKKETKSNTDSSNQGKEKLRIPDSTYVQQIIDNTQPKQVNNSISIDSNNYRKPQSTSSPLSDIKKNINLIELVNKSEKANFAVLATTNGKKDNQLAFAFVDWLKKYGTASQSILLNSFIEQGYFKQILDDNSSVIKNTNVNESAKYICLIRSKIDFSKSKVDEKALTVANCFYEVIIVETISGKVIDTFTQQDSPSDISEKRARQRADASLSEYLAKRKLLL